ncbi:hypothetical protein F52700_4070 [Fusarium sp. NRRL 52700]|nr:hypothetical protein F52700_4070 [Fusarium sp. NRRL 52700]
MAKVKPFSTKSDSHWKTLTPEAKKYNPVEELAVAQSMDEMKNVEEPAAKRRALSSGILNARSFEYRDLQDRRRRPTESHSDSVKKGQTACSRGRRQDRDGATQSGGSRHHFQVRIRNLSPLEDDVEMKDDDMSSKNPTSRTTGTTWMSQEEADAAVYCLGPLDATS